MIKGTYGCGLIRAQFGLKKKNVWGGGYFRKSRKVQLLRETQS